MVSLVMPVWRPHREWLFEAVSSALAETGCAIELIVVDDGNAESVDELLSGFADPRLRVLRVPHGGVCRARNAGIDAARGSAIRFIDADDVVEPGSTARLARLSNGEAIAYGSTLVCDPQLRPMRLVEETIQGDAFMECLLGGFDVYITAMLFPRAVIAAMDGFDPDFDLNEDFEFVLRSLEKAPVRGESFVATRYRRHGDSATAGDQAGRMMDMLALDKLFARRPDLRSTRIERVARAHLYVVAATQLLRADRYREAVGRLARALLRAPLAMAPEVARAAAGAPRLAARRLLAALR